jgi:hypothetical protein
MIHELRKEIGGATHFSTIDLHQGYHQIRMNPEDRAKTAFSTPFGHLQWNVFAFGLCNALAVFQQLLDSVYEDEMGKFVVMYLDDILVYSRNEAEHADHLRERERLITHIWPKRPRPTHIDEAQGTQNVCQTQQVPLRPNGGGIPKPCANLQRSRDEPAQGVRSKRLAYS